MDQILRTECQSLLEKLRTSQQSLTGHISSQISKENPNSKIAAPIIETDPITSYNLNKIMKDKTYNSKFGVDITTKAVNVAKEADTHLKPTVSRNRLSSLIKGPSDDQIEAIQVNHQESYNKSRSQKENFSMDGKHLKHKSMFDLSKSPTCQEQVSFSTDSKALSSSQQPATPNTQRRRQLIDRHTSVPTKLSAKELQDLDNERLLNFSYSYINVDDNITHFKSSQDFSDCHERCSPNHENVNIPFKKSETKLNVKNPQSTVKESANSALMDDFQSQLKDDGNNRKLNKFIRTTESKPKSILNSSAYYNLSCPRKNNSSVHFSTSQINDSETSIPDHRLLGYDWIAALLDNDSALINQSESFFDELRDFRKAHKDECSNQFYMESPHTLVDTEPAEIIEALTEPKVRPYVVNERLFTEPFRSNLIPYEDENHASKREEKEASKDNPRFVRVSIPRSTLQTPYRVKPHRRRSFDAADSCALIEHCLLGWENTRPEMLPAAQSLDLNTEAGTRQDSVVTSLAEAERLATRSHHSGWPAVKPQGRLLTLPSWSKHYRDTTLNLTQPVTRSNCSVTSLPPGEVKRTTDKLLHTTYSNMYEMERLRQQRELERKKEEMTVIGKK